MVLQPLVKQLRRVKRSVSKATKGPEIMPWPDTGGRTIELIYWRPQSGYNFGDELSRVIVQLMLARKGLTAEDEIVKRRRMLAIGSILHQAEDDTIVWGTGRNGLIPDRAHFFDRLDVRAVRGPRTAEFLRRRGIAVPDVFGDPGLLLPRLTGHRFVRGNRGPVFVPNLNDYRAGFDFGAMSIPVIDPRQAWNVVVDQIVQHDFVLASSLHGLIVAEAFGIPARYVRLTHEEAEFKYHDYYEGTGRFGVEVANSVDEGLEMKGVENRGFALDALESAFPYDVWLAGDRRSVS